MKQSYEAVIGVEVHAELQTASKMFCGCPVVDFTEAPPNIAVCPVCAGMPGALPVANQRAVEYALRVALALGCEIATTSLFARKNYFYPDLPKGYQISQYDSPLARHGSWKIFIAEREKRVRIRRVHIEEDTGRLTHVAENGETYSLVDINRAGVPLLEIVSEPDLHTVAEVRAYATSLRSLLRYLGVNSGDMEKGLLRIEPNVSVRPVGSQRLGTRVEVKNLNSFRALERAVEFEIRRQIARLRAGEEIVQETVGWDENQEITFTQRVKEAEDDYRYFPEPDLPPLVLDPAWIERIRAGLPELPAAKLERFTQQYGLRFSQAQILVADQEVADYFEGVLAGGPEVTPQTAFNWVAGELFSLLNQAGLRVNEARVPPEALRELILQVERGEINQNTGKAVLAEMFTSGARAPAIIAERGLQQISDVKLIREVVRQVLEANPDQAANYLAGKGQLARWLFGQVMQATKGRGDPKVVQVELERQLKSLRGK